MAYLIWIRGIVSGLTVKTHSILNKEAEGGRASGQTIQFCIHQPTCLVTTVQPLEAKTGFSVCGCSTALPAHQRGALAFQGFLSGKIVQRPLRLFPRCVLMQSSTVTTGGPSHMDAHNPIHGSLACLNSVHSTHILWIRYCDSIIFAIALLFVIPSLSSEFCCLVTARPHLVSYRDPCS